MSGPRFGELSGVDDEPLLLLLIADDDESGCAKLSERCGDNIPEGELEPETADVVAPTLSLRTTLIGPSASSPPAGKTGQPVTNCKNAARRRFLEEKPAATSASQRTWQLLEL